MSRTSGFRVTCYGKTTEYKEKDRSEVLREYEKLIYASEGSERDRYVSVFFGVINLKENVDDGWVWKFGEAVL